MKLDFNLEEHLTSDEIKDIVKDELRERLREHFKKNPEVILSNLCYSIVQEEVNNVIPDYEMTLKAKVVELLNSDLRFQVFYRDSFYNKPSTAVQIIEQTVKDNQELIKERVRETIQNKDFSEEAWMKFESLTEDFCGNIYDFINIIKTKAGGN